MLAQQKRLPAFRICYAEEDFEEDTMKNDTGKQKEQGRRRRHILRTVLVVLVASVAACALGLHIYAADYCHATAEAKAALASTDDVTVTELENGDVLFVPEKTQAAFVFYPGGKVEATAYAPLLERLAERHVACVLTKMPENLAVLSPAAADRSRPELEEALVQEGIDTASVPWLIGGHSLGGAMAGTYAAGHEGAWQGLVLLAAYETEDIHESSMKALLIYGEHDGVLNRARYEECRANLPEGSCELVIPGGIHSYFGSYGIQDGDGEPEIANDEQLDEAARAIAAFAESLA